ncbi:MAG TPA: hypothetical protein VG712_06395, partial [Gemmatimonadales bacterium]|nr:hypothetical protein [Gemmatimonadales bacterium]
QVAGVPINPLGTWRKGSSIEVYTELRGIPAGTDARATFEIRRLDRATGRPAVRVTSTLTSSGDLTPLARSVGLGRLGVGIYRLTLTVEAPDGVRLVREKVFEVVD